MANFAIKLLDNRIQEKLEKEPFWNKINLNSIYMGFYWREVDWDNTYVHLTFVSEDDIRFDEAKKWRSKRMAILAGQGWKDLKCACHEFANKIKYISIDDKEHITLCNESIKELKSALLAAWNSKYATHFDSWDAYWEEDRIQCRKRIQSDEWHRMHGSGTW